MTIDQIIENLLEDIRGDLRKEYEQQGHKLSGRLIRELRIEVTNSVSGTVGRIYAVPYARYLETGVAPSKIPFSPGSGKRTSKYIEALIDYWKKRGRTPADAKRAAFATANKHKREGMPTRSSFKFSRNGRRTGAIREVRKANEQRVISIIQEELSNDIRVTISEGIKTAFA